MINRFAVCLVALFLVAGCAIQPIREVTRPGEIDTPSTTPSIVEPNIDIVEPKPSNTPTSDSAPPTTPSTEPDTEPEEKVDCRKVKCVALTIDDGPSIYSEKALAIFKEKDVKVTYFLKGENVKAFPKVVKHMAEGGHSVQNHSYNHPEFWKMTAEAIKSQLTRTNALIKKQTGKNPVLFRPPYGESNPTVRKIGKNLKMAQILWSVDPNDWRDRDTDTVVERIVSAAKPGSIILTHELYMTTIKAYPIIIDKLREKGYVFVTVQEIIGSKLVPGKNYSKGVAPAKKKKTK